MNHSIIAEFTAKIDAACEEAHRGCGLSDVLFTARFQEACEGLLASVPTELHAEALAIVKAQGFEPDNDPDQDFGPGECSMTGIDEHCCPCGRHP
jgi:hypothetical protein